AESPFLFQPAKRGGGSGNRNHPDYRVKTPPPVGSLDPPFPSSIDPRLGGDLLEIDPALALWRQRLGDHRPIAQRDRPALDIDMGQRVLAPFDVVAIGEILMRMG